MDALSLVVAVAAAGALHGSGASDVPPVLRLTPDRVLSTVGEPSGAVGAKARLAQTVDGVEIFVVPTASGSCLVTASTSETFCATRGVIRRTGAIGIATCSSALPRGRVEIAGLVPDGVARVWLRLSDGRRVGVGVRSNTFLARFRRGDALPRSLSWRAADGRRHDVDAPVHATPRCRPSGRVPDLWSWRPDPPPVPTEPVGHAVTNGG